MKDNEKDQMISAICVGAIAMAFLVIFEGISTFRTWFVESFILLFAMFFLFFPLVRILIGEKTVKLYDIILLSLGAAAWVMYSIYANKTPYELGILFLQNIMTVSILWMTLFVFFKHSIKRRVKQ
jgi:hypothetical protein